MHSGLDMPVHLMHDWRMLLETYLAKTGKTDAEFAVEVGLSRPMVTRLRRRQSGPSFESALRIVAATSGEVTADDLRPLPVEAEAQQ